MGAQGEESNLKGKNHENSSKYKTGRLDKKFRYGSNDASSERNSFII